MHAAFLFLLLCCLFKQKTAYEMRISDWSSDVCSSDLGWNGNWFGHGDEFSFTEATPDFDLKAITDYARKKGVTLIGHHETGGNIANYEAQLVDAMKLYGQLGVKAVKTGYVADAGGIIAPGETPGTDRKSTRLNSSP